MSASRPSRGAGLVWPLAIFVLAAIPRIIGLDARPLWLDEVFTLQRVNLPAPALVVDSFTHHHMPSFFLLLAPLAPLGHPEFWLRLPSALFGALAVALVYVIGARVAGRRAGVLAALVLGLSPAALAYSQEARSYTLVMCLVLVALYGIVCLAQDVAGAAAQPLRASPMRFAWACFILGTTAALDVLGDSLPWLIAANLVALALYAQSGRPRGLLINFLKADLFIAVCTAPFYGVMHLYEDHSFAVTLAWIPPLNFTRLWYSFGSVYFMQIADSVTFHLMEVSTPALIVWLLDAGLVLAVGAAAWRLRHRPALLTVLGIAFVFLPALLTLISVWQPVLLPRYILWSAAPFAILAGIGASALLDHLPARAHVPVMGATALLLLTNMAPYYKAETKPRWDVAAQILAGEVQPGDVLLLHDPYDGTLLNVYLPPGKRGTVLADSQGDAAHAQAAMAQGKRVWTVYGVAGQGKDDAQEHASFDARAAGLGTPSLKQAAGKRITITLYDPAAQPKSGH
jgi:uncharacterized membrane protein